MSYCTVDEVIHGPLKGIDLSQLGATDAINDYVEGLLPAAKRMIDGAAGRDFDYHAGEDEEGETVTLNGNGADRIAVWKTDRTLCVPIVEVTDVSVYGAELDITDLKVDAAAGIIGFQDAPTDRLAMRRAARRGSTARFPKDFQNVAVTLIWGYETPPDDVTLAQALVTACYALLSVGGGKSGGVLARKIEDFEVQYGEGQYRSQIREWSQRALLILNAYRTGIRTGSV